MVRKSKIRQQCKYLRISLIRFKNVFNQIGSIFRTRIRLRVVLVKGVANVSLFHGIKHFAQGLHLVNKNLTNQFWLVNQ